METETLSETSLLTDRELGTRWHCHGKTAVRRMAKFGVRPIKLSRKSTLYRWSDVLRVEEQCR